MYPRSPFHGPASWHKSIPSSGRSTIVGVERAPKVAGLEIAVHPRCGVVPARPNNVDPLVGAVHRARESSKGRARAARVAGRRVRRRVPRSIQAFGGRSWAFSGPRAFVAAAAYVVAMEGSAVGVGIIVSFPLPLLPFSLPVFILQPGRTSG